ncbi:hypothetical protein B9Z55_021847 [Caenorhabditis nigoni]|uniref:Integrase catalytic domain-containing protein n=1 Tax=Caenorhabditis nigoni TaxID=1611254 RepID=A0A2G5TTQ2_9PELO|nr:hypothetical protein B9Z55_021847 [Caenorhabditis nigoni]
MLSSRAVAAIKDAWSNPKHPCAFTSVANVHNFLKPRFKNLKYDQVEKVLEDVESFTLHRPTRKKFPRLKTMAAGVYTQLQIDLADMSKYKTHNDGTTFLLTIMDIFSRRLFVKPLKSKGGKEVASALSQIFEEMGSTPITVYSDEGKEFYNTEVSRLFKKEGVKHISPKSDLKCAVVERANRTLKTRLAKFMTQKYNYRYINVLQSVVKGINNSVNRGIGKKPVDVENGDFIVPFPDHSGARIKYQLGDHVRISAKKGNFDKGYEQGWTTEVYVISRVIPRKPVVYNLVDTNGEEIDGIFYTRELTKCTYDPDAVYRIEKVLDTRVWKGKKQSLVKWEGYPESFASWINTDSMISI